MRQRIQRSTSTTPMAANNRPVCQAMAMGVSCVITRKAGKTITTFPARATHTSERGDGSSFSTRGANNRL